MTLISFVQIIHTCMHTKFRLSKTIHSNVRAMSTYVVVLSWMQHYVVDEARVIFLKSRNFKILTKKIKILISQRRIVVGQLQKLLSVVSSHSMLWGPQANTSKLQVKNWKNRLLIINFFPVDKFGKSFFITDVGIQPS